MMSLLNGLHNMESRRTLRTPDGVWDMAVLVDIHSLNDEQLADALRITNLARLEGISVCNKVSEFAEASVHTLFVMGHNVGIEEPGVLKEIDELGEQLKEKWILLNICGKDKFSFEIFNLEQKINGSIVAYNDFPSTGVIVHVFEAFVSLVRAEPRILPEEALARVLGSNSPPSMKDNSNNNSAKPQSMQG